MNETNLIEYSREIMPRVRIIEAKKQELKEYKDSNEHVAELQQAVKQAQQDLATFLEKEDTVVAMSEELKALDKELKEALKSASRASGYKAGKLKTFFKARAKEKAVEKAVEKGELFIELTTKIDTLA